MPMMDTIRDLVMQKRMFTEAANLILEDESLDDLVLEADNNLPEGTKDPLENDNSAVQRDGELPMSTGERDNDSDLMTQEIDLRSDTVSNVVPVPPAAAANQMDDLMDQPIDSPTPSADTPASPAPEPESEPEPTPEAPSRAPEGDLMDQPLPSPSSNDSSSSSSSEKDLLDEPLTSAEKDSVTKEESGDLLESKLFESGEGYAPNLQDDYFDDPLDGDSFGESVIDDDLNAPRPNRTTNFLGNIFGESKREPEPRNLTDDDVLEETAEILKNWKPKRRRRDIDFMMEAISVDGADDDDAEITDDDDDAPDSDNTVTAAVKDKVGEIETDDDTEPDAFSADVTDGGGSSGNAKFYKKLSKLTKDIEDIKAEVVLNKE